MHKRIFLGLLICFSAASAQAASWVADPQGNYSLVAKGQALTVECRAGAEQGGTAAGVPGLYYWPSCNIGCKDTVLDDPTRKATILVDEHSFPATITTADAEALPLLTGAEAQQILDALAKGHFVSVYSGQITPKYSAFENISNPEVLAQFYARCVSAPSAAPAP